MMLDPEPSEMLDHHEFGPGAKPVQGKYARRYEQGTNVVLLDPDLAKRFPTSVAVNDALRHFLQLDPKTPTDG
ncbi:hypothetical protein [Neorhodopirellula pilleata]|uniref:Uncharacterized protein n=1 Tax=Neorhodopirellula pilleata TaxID=2714738 RepID=A0A5C6ANK2_9BACT|nr:hypothetical protein [Neorhodopirellula pilleata]TWU01555.1 hypothetical protein Pla100_12900 [Neorhodopirellula pilleata]